MGSSLWPRFKLIAVPRNKHVRAHSFSRTSRTQQNSVIKPSHGPPLILAGFGEQENGGYHGSNRSLSRAGHAQARSQDRSDFRRGVFLPSGGRPRLWHSW